MLYARLAQLVVPSSHAMWSLLAVPRPFPPINFRLSPTMSSAPTRRVGFDKIADMIRDLSIGVTSLSSKLRGALTTASGSVKSSFVITTWKKKQTVDNTSSATPDLLCTAPTKSPKRASTTIALGSPLTTPASSATRNPSLTRFHVDPSHPPAAGFVVDWSDAMLIDIDQDIVRPRITPRTSVIQPVYRRSLPSDIVQLMVGEEIIVDIPIHGDAPWRGNDAGARRFHYRKLYENIICRTFWGKDSENNMDSIIRDRHTLLCGGTSYLEFPVG